MTEQNQNMKDWIELEEKEMGTTGQSIFEKLPAMKFVENKIEEMTVDLSKRFETYNTTDFKQNPVRKAIIPVLHDGIKKNWWLNKKNPIYREILEMGKKSDTAIIRVLQTGTAQNTKYLLVK